ncbi:MAG: hypothetical protein ACXAE3_09300 [Candidatus Kariarchaeaceae archaeon]
MDLKKLPPALFEIVGGAVLVIPIIIGVSRGIDPTDLLFGRVVATLAWTLALRPLHFFVFMLGLVAILLSVYAIFRSRRKEISDRLSYIRYGLYFVSGYLLITYGLHWVLNAIFYRDAFVAYTYLIGVIFLTVLLLQLAIDVRDIGDRHTIIKVGKSIRYLLLIGLALIIVVPTLLPMSGLMPALPTEQPDYGSEAGPYAVTQTRIEQSVPANISNYLIDDNDNSSWYNFIYHPQVPSSDPINMPVVLLMHGYTGTDPSDYRNTVYQLASQGAVVIFVQWVSNVILEGPYEDADDVDIKASNAQYIRYSMAWNAVSQSVDYLLSDDSPLTASMDLSYLLIIGHSMGAGMVPYIATQSVRQGWGDEMLILDMETPWFTGTHPQAQSDFDLLPDHTLVNVATSADDHLTSPCIGVQGFEFFHATLPENNLAFIIIPSDDHGFPRLIASHYLMTDRVNDHLTLWGYLKRVDAMTVMLVENANNNPISTTSYFLGGGEAMISQGEWSDGTPVAPLVYSQDPYGQRGGDNLAEQFIDAHSVGPEICVV